MKHIMKSHIQVHRHNAILLVSLLLASNLLVPPLFAPINVQAAPLKRLQIAIDKVEALDSLDNPFGDTDFYAKVSIGDATFSSPTTQDDNIITPNWLFFLDISPKQTSIPLSIEIWDEDDQLRINDDQADINPHTGKQLRFTLNPLTCSINGDIQGVCNQAFTSTGNEFDRVFISFRIEILTSLSFTRIRMVVSKIVVFESLDDILPNTNEIYSKGTINGIEGRSTVQVALPGESVRFSWTYEVEVDRRKITAVPLRLEIWEEDVSPFTEDDQADINPTNDNALNMILDINSCRILGDILGSCNQHLTSIGTGNNRALVQLRIESELVQIAQDPDTSSTPFPAKSHRTIVEPDAYSYGPFVVTSFQVGRAQAGGANMIGYSVTNNNGNSWLSGILPGITKAYGGGSYDTASDPAVAYTERHKVWLIASLPNRFVDGIPFSDSVLVSRSTDNGITWDLPTIVAGNLRDADKTWIVCDNYPSSPNYGNCYYHWNSGIEGIVYNSTSSDGGLTWSIPITLPTVSAGVGGQPVVLPSGIVVVPIASGNYSSLLSYRSLDGGQSWENYVLIDAVKTHEKTNVIRNLLLPSADVSPDGTIFVVWHTCEFRSPACKANDLAFSKSRDGLNWTTPVRIPITTLDSSIDAFVPSIAIDPHSNQEESRLSVLYYYLNNTDCVEVDCNINIAIVFSEDGGANWSQPRHLAGPMPLLWFPDTTLGRMFGDYTGISYSENGRVHPIFAIARQPEGVQCIPQIQCDTPLYTVDRGLDTIGGNLPIEDQYGTPVRAGVISQPNAPTTIMLGGDFGSVQIPSHTFADTTIVNVTQQYNLPNPPPIYLSVLQNFSIEGYSLANFNNSVTPEEEIVINLRYEHHIEINSITNASMLPSILYWDADALVWREIPTDTDLSMNTVTARIKSFGQYVLVSHNVSDTILFLPWVSCPQHHPVYVKHYVEICKAP
jgi:hypothetical protein